MESEVNKCTTAVVDMSVTMINEEYRKVGIYKINVEVSRVAWSIKIDILDDMSK